MAARGWYSDSGSWAAFNRPSRVSAGTERLDDDPDNWPSLQHSSWTLGAIRARVNGKVRND
jgi:hypothetical protein